MKIKFKPIVFDAIKFHGFEINKLEYDSFLRGAKQQILRNGQNMIIVMPHGSQSMVRPGDWIGKAPDGILYSIAKDEFVNIFEEYIEPQKCETESKQENLHNQRS